MTLDLYSHVEPAPPELAPKLAEAKHRLVHNLERGWTRARYIGLETRAADQLVVLRFEIPRARSGS